MKALLKTDSRNFTIVKPKNQKKIPAISFFEFWPGWLFYAPVAVYCLYLSLRYGGLTVPTAANPSIKNSGVVGESKVEILDLIPSEHVADYVPVCTSENAFESAQQAIRDKGLSFPLVAKPDNGCRGMGVQLLKSDADLGAYIEAFPKDQMFVLQALADYEEEYGIFYIRQPDEEKGRVVSLTVKKFPYVYGDGHSTIEELVMKDERAAQLHHLYLPKLGEGKDRVLSVGEPFRLLFTGAHSKGTIFKDGADLITPALEARIDEIARQIPEFYFGRFDIRTASLSDLEAGKNFKIIELNGATGEMTHIWDSKTTLTNAYKAQFYQYKILFQIGKKNIARGFKITSISALWDEYKLYKNLSQVYPPTH